MKSKDSKKLRSRDLKKKNHRRRATNRIQIAIEEEKQNLETEQKQIENTQIIQEETQQICNELNKANKLAQVKLLVNLEKFPVKTASKVLKCIKEMLKEEENPEINEKFVVIIVNPENVDETTRKIGKMRIEGTKLNVQNGFEKGE
ncbi:Hypothetical_protein [Hexamita inflata]|uniref:Hypothetical_protein n=1 Tax=Hexamita inflata TaxID=28002 RepID=A0AA86RE03_9EUKA|nr:Hypothetical protein HINF_LOCUS64264 [Hexamita inflata]